MCTMYTNGVSPKKEKMIKGPIKATKELDIPTSPSRTAALQGMCICMYIRMYIYKFVSRWTVTTTKSTTTIKWLLL